MMRSRKWRDHIFSKLFKPLKPNRQVEINCISFFIILGEHSYYKRNNSFNRSEFEKSNRVGVTQYKNALL